MTTTSYKRGHRLYKKLMLYMFHIRGGRENIINRQPHWSLILYMFLYKFFNPLFVLESKWFITHERRNRKHNQYLTLQMFDFSVQFMFKFSDLSSNPNYLMNFCLLFSSAIPASSSLAAATYSLSSLSSTVLTACLHCNCSGVSYVNFLWFV